MSFAHPMFLIVGLVAALALTWLYVAAERRKTAQDLAYSSIAFFAQAVAPRPWIPRLLRIAWIAGVLALAVAIAGPRLVVPVPAHDAAVFICIDTSGSMQSTDVQPTRAQAATAAARAFIAQAPSGTKIGLIAFASDAQVVQPLTADHDQAIAALDEIPTPNGATSIGDALQLAVQGLPASGHRAIVLITDGVNNHGVDPNEVAQYLGSHHIPVYTVGIGTPNGDVIPGTSEQAGIDEDALRSYAEVSGGAYARAENARDLREALSRLGSVTTIEPRKIDASLGFALGGALIIAGVFIAGFTLGRVP